MESVTFTVNTVIDHLSKALYGAQTEILIFLFAFCLHAIFFNKLRVPSKPSQRLKVLSTGGKPQDDPAAHRPPVSKELAGLAERYCQLTDAAELAADLSVKIQAVREADVMDALVGLLEGAGKASTPQLLAAVRALLRQRGSKPSLDLGELLLRIYSGLRLWEEFDEVYRELVSEHGVVASVAVLALKASLASGDLQACLDRSSCLKPLPRTAFASLLQQMVRLVAQQQALPQFLERLQDVDVLAAALDPVLVECVKRGDAADIGTVLQCSQQHGLQFGEPAYCALIKSAQHSQEALSLFSEALVTLETPPKDLFIVAAEWALEHDDKQLANSILQKLPSKPPGEAVGRLLSVCSGLCPRQALQMYKEKFHGVDLSVDIKAMHLVALGALEDGTAGAKLLQSMLMASAESARVSLVKSFASEKQLVPALEVLRLSPDKGSCLHNATIDACIECGSIDDAQQVMSAAVQAGVADLITYNTIVKAYLQAKRPLEARQAIRAMKADGIKPNVVTFNELLDGIVKAGFDGAWPVLNEMRAAECRPNRITCAILLKAVQPRTKPADVERAIAVLDETGEDLDEVLLCSVVDACIRAGRAELLIPQLKRQRATGRTMMKGANANSAHTYGSIIRAYGFVHDLHGAWETWREMCTRHMPPNPVTLGCMTEALVTNGEPEAAYELINEMIKDEHWAPLVNAVIYCSVLKGFSHQKRFDRMWEVYHEMLGLKLKFSIVTFNTLLDACSRNGEMSRIPALLKDMDAQGIPPNIITYGAILKGYCQENRIDEAFSVFEGMIQTTNIRPDEIMFNTLLDGCARKGLYDRGIGILEDMKKANITPTNFTLSVLVKLASRSKRLDSAFELCQAISAKYKFRLNVHVYANLINACISHKDCKRAFAVLDGMLTERVRPDTRTYSLLLRAYVAAGQDNDAAGLLRAALGLGDVHARLAHHDARLMQPQGGLPSPLLTEILEGLAGQCGNEQLAVGLIKDIRTLPHIKLDPKLQFRLATFALNR